MLAEGAFPRTSCYLRFQATSNVLAFTFDEKSMLQGLVSHVNVLSIPKVFVAPCFGPPCQRLFAC